MKNARLAFIFKSKTKVDTKRLTFIIRSLIGLCLAIEVSLLLAWTLKATTKPVQITANSISFAACASKDLPGSPTIKLLQAYNISLLLCLPILAYVLKDVDPILNESPAILTTGAIVGIMAAVLAILPSNPSYNLDMASSLCIWAATTLTQCTLFASKVNEVLFQELIEKGLLKRSLKSSFEAGASRHTQTMGVKPPLRAMAPSVVGGGVVRVSALSTRNVSANELDAKAKLNPEEHEQGVSSNTDQQYTSVSGISQRDSSALDRIKKEEPPGMRIQKTSKTSFRGMPAKVSTTTPGLERDATIKGDPGYRRHPVECLAIVSYALLFFTHETGSNFPCYFKRKDCKSLN
ncbi:hypothetical protein BC830DRAFT_313313 [Chytriomyces sp. MP71]|nr:hypothetical protein BC830DRAFT_313313 [Chytriomyces sp. MP71]